MVNCRKLFIGMAVSAMLMTGNQTEAAQSNAPQGSNTPTINTEQVTLLGQQVIEIKYGMRGDGVMDVQKALTRVGYNVGTIDGIFGWQTFDAVKDFQTMHQLSATGIVDDATMQALHRAEPLSSRGMRIIPMHASGYSAYDPGNSYYTATGSFLRKGIVAVDPNIIPLGTRLFIPGYGYAVADDTGGSIVGTRIDLAFDSHEEALWFGRRDIVVYVVD